MRYYRNLLQEKLGTEERRCSVVCTSLFEEVAPSPSAFPFPRTTTEHFSWIWVGDVSNIAWRADCGNRRTRPRLRESSIWPPPLITGVRFTQPKASLFVQLSDPWTSNWGNILWRKSCAKYWINQIIPDVRRTILLLESRVAPPHD